MDAQRKIQASLGLTGQRLPRNLQKIAVDMEKKGLVKKS